MGKKEFMALTADEKNLINRVTVKKLKEGFGHDMMGYYCDVYLDNKKIGFVNDDGWGGETLIEYTNDKTKETFEAFLTDNKISRLLYNKLGWNFYDNEDKVGILTQGIALVELAINKKNEVKEMKKIQKRCVKSFVYGRGFDDNSHSLTWTARGWKGVDLQTIRNHPKMGVDALQKLYDEIKAELKDGEVFFNTNLEELGIKL
jgi:hypothetical protein